MIQGVLLDLSGVLYEGDVAVPGADGALARLKRAGPSMGYATNTSRRTRRDIAAKHAVPGFDVAEEIVTAPLTALHAVRRRGLRPFLLIHPALAPDFHEVETDRPDPVLIGDAARRFTHDQLNHAFRVLMCGAPLLAVARNRYFREGDGPSLDAGGFVALLKYASGVVAELFGKPAPGFFESAVAATGRSPEDVAMVGDDVESDVLGAANAGLQGVLVRTGKYRPGDEERLGHRATVVDDCPAAVS